jgi:hypothetical protein
MTLPGSESLPSTAAMIAELDQIMILGYAAPERKRELVFSPKFADEDANYGRLCSSARRRLDFVSQEHFKFITRRCTEEHTCDHRKRVHRKMFSSRSITRNCFRVKLSTSFTLAPPRLPADSRLEQTARNYGNDCHVFAHPIQCFLESHLCRCHRGWH